MPFLDSTYLPSTIFILTHVLGIAGVLYWKRYARGRAGNCYSLNLLWGFWGWSRRQRSSQLLSLKGQYFLLTGVLSDLNVCVDLLRKLGCPGTSLGSSLFPGLWGNLAGGGRCWFGEVMSGLEVEGSGNSTDFCLSLENQPLPFLTFSLSKWFLDLCF